LQFQQWAEEYGYDKARIAGYMQLLIFFRPIYSLMLGTRVWIILSSDASVRDLLDKRSNIYSSRPDMYMGQEIASGGLRLVTMVSNLTDI
jgi:hypothetical protein